jgi:hypothetical protein
MNQEELVNIIYKYYPKGITTQNPDKYESSVENIRRLKLCDVIKVSNQNKWEFFKNDLLKYIEGQSSSFSDYTSFGGIPNYIIEIAIRNEQSTNGPKIILHVLISFITDYWIFRFLDTTYKDNFRFQVTGPLEAEIIQNITQLIYKHFPAYRPFPLEMYNIVVPDIDTPLAHDNEVTIGTAIFMN